MDSPHRPALVSEVVKLLSGKAIVIDATVGSGGHAQALLRSGAGTVVGVDRDPSALRWELLWFKPSELGGQPLPTAASKSAEERYELLRKLQGILQALGFVGIVVLIDRVDEPQFVVHRRSLAKLTSPNAFDFNGGHMGVR